MSGKVGGAGSNSGIIGSTELYYEEGVFTPQLTSEGGSGECTYPVDGPAGIYTKIGRQVMLQMKFNITGKGSTSGNIQIEGLPFTPVDILVGTSYESGGSVSEFLGTSAGISFMSCLVAQQGHVKLSQIEGTSTTDMSFLNISQIDNDFGLRCQVNYMVPSDPSQILS